jgi:type IV secretion system protein TrbL
MAADVFYLKDLPGPCEIPGVSFVCGELGDAADKAKDIVQKPGDIISFTSDPLGYIAQKMQEAAAGLADSVLPQLEKLTQPDLTADWFLDAYKVSFALAIPIFALFLGWNFVQLARRRVSGDEVAETLGVYAPLFFGGTLLGPAAGAGLLSFTGALTDSLLKWGVQGNVETTLGALKKAIDEGDSTKIAGGAIVAIIFFFCLIIALIFSFITLLVMLVTLYLTGALIPLSLVWLVHPRQRNKGLKIVMVWVGICFSHVLLFLLLGIAFKMVSGLTLNFDKPGLTILANLAVAIIALLTATLSPFGLLAFAPVGPSASSASGASFSLPAGRSVGGGYDSSASDSQAAQMARDGDEPGEFDDTTDDSSGGLADRLSSSGQAESSASMEGDESSHETSGREKSAEVISGESDTELSEREIASGDGAEQLEEASETADEVGSSVSQTGRAVQGAGAAVAATGVGAPVAAVMEAVGTGVEAVGDGIKGAAKVVNKTAQMAQVAGDMAAQHMDHGENNGGSNADSRPRR